MKMSRFHRKNMTKFAISLFVIPMSFLNLWSQTLPVTPTPPPIIQAEADEICLEGLKIEFIDPEHEGQEEYKFLVEHLKTITTSSCESGGMYFWTKEQCREYTQYHIDRGMNYIREANEARRRTKETGETVSVSDVYCNAKRIADIDIIVIGYPLAPSFPQKLVVQKPSIVEESDSGPRQRKLIISLPPNLTEYQYNSIKPSVETYIGYMTRWRPGISRDEPNYIYTQSVPSRTTRD